MNYDNPSSLIQLTIQSLLKDDNLAISSLKDIPDALLPSLFLKAHIQGCYKTLKAIVLSWPFERLPLGSLVHDRAPENPSFKAVMDGIDVLIKQKVSPRCRLQVLDLQFTGQKFWNTWTGSHLQAYSQKRELMSEGTSKKEKATPYLEVCVDLYLGEEQVDRFSTYLLNWTKKRKGVHLSYKTVRIHYLTRKYFRFLYAVSCCDIMELGIHCTLPFSTLHMLANLLGMLSNLKRMVVCIKIPTATTPEKAEWRLLSINNFTSECSQLLHLQELYLESPSFLKDHLHCLFRCFNTSLEVFSLTNCRFRKKVLTHVFQSPCISQLKDLCLKGVPLTSVSKCLRSLLEVNASTLQHLDLGLCGLQDPQLEVLLPALSSCSQLRSFSLHGNCLSMATLEKLLSCTSGLSRLKLELYPAPLESFSPQGVLQPATFRLHCTQIIKILKDLRHSRSIVVSTGQCSSCAEKMFRNGEPIILPCKSCVRKFKKLSIE
ncbi:PRAME family member 7-like [Erinaceus europaeus]|uniref:PRAME family member 7-like n=1 Tax=Erinaceus europaeus TaxID=9365 RepID=A0ABM3YBB9_ERIEU|nr:PRAME family member 7-like [Erinaceus europaeus]